jgi:hypothetical protein
MSRPSKYDEDKAREKARALDQVALHRADASGVSRRLARPWRRGLRQSRHAGEHPEPGRPLASRSRAFAEPLTGRCLNVGAALAAEEVIEVRHEPPVRVWSGRGGAGAHTGEGKATARAGVSIGVLILSFPSQEFRV